MSSIIPTLFSGNYYAIPTDTPASSGASGALPAPVSVAGLLLKAESAASGGDTVDLSPAAQNILGFSAASSGFTLNAAQQQTLTQILTKYQNAPLTQDTFDQIQDDLKAAGISPDQLAGKDLASGFNTGRDELDAFEGTTSDDVPTLTGEQAKSTAYINQIYSQLQALSAKAAASNSTSVTS